MSNKNKSKIHDENFNTQNNVSFEVVAPKTETPLKKEDERIVWMKNAEDHNVLFISGRKDKDDDNFDYNSNETCCDRIKLSLLSNYKLLSFTTLVILADITMFLVSLLLPGGMDSTSDHLLWQVSAQNLIQFGALNSILVSQGQVYRIISYMFLHLHFVHIICNLITTFCFLPTIEKTFGWWRAALIYFLSGISASMFSLLLHQNPNFYAVGASGAVFGIIGVIFGYIILNWTGLDEVGPELKRCVFINAVVLIVVIGVSIPVMDLTFKNIDYWAHLGGFLGGLWMSCIGNTIQNGKLQKILRIIFGSLMIVQLVVCFALFFTRSY